MGRGSEYEERGPMGPTHQPLLALLSLLTPPRLTGALTDSRGEALFEVYF